jgi:cerevisin
VGSGTAMASPYVAGAIAVLLGKDGNCSPAEMATKLRNLAERNVLSGVRECLTCGFEISLTTP